MIPTLVGRELERGLEEHLKAQFPVSTPTFKGLWDEFFSGGRRVLKGPWLSLPLPFRKDGSEAARARFAPALDRLPFSPYAHQVKAWDRIERFLPTLVATGTGSGKTECFTYPVLRHCAAFAGEPGIRAIFVYPMNALATDQAARLARLVARNPGLKDVRIGLYIGEKPNRHRRGAPPPKSRSREMTADSVITDREAILQSPPHILLTNYKMLDYMLVRPHEAALWSGNKPGVLRFLAVDELHTFDGAQAADLACLVRRLKERLRIDNSDPAQRLCCIGTSATMGSGAESARQVAAFATQVFDATFDEASLIGEDRLSPDEALPPAEGPAWPAGAAFLPSQGESPADYLARQRSLWALADPADILKRPFVQEAVRRLADGPLDIVTLSASLAEAANAASWTDPPLDAAGAEAGLRSVCALLSDLRASKGRDYPEVRMQLWARELARMAASVGAAPRLVFSDDLSEPERLRDEASTGAATHYRPLLNCRECGCTGYLALHNRRSGKLDGTRRQIYMAHMGRGSDELSLFVPLRDGEAPPPLLEGGVRKVCPHCLTVLPETAAKCPGCGAEDLLRMAEQPSRAVGQGPRARHELVCPKCGAGSDGLLLFGMRSATLLSHFVQVLTSSRFNDDRKIIAFSDNVQDSAHRAGFFGARTWTGTFHAHLAQFLAGWLPGSAGAAASAPSLAETADAFESHLRALYPDSRDLMGMLLPQDLKDIPAWHALQEKPEEPIPSAGAVNALFYRLRWEVAQEFGLRSNVGRTLPRLGIAEAFPVLPPEEDPVWGLLADALASRTEALRVFAGNPALARAAADAVAREMIRLGAFDDGDGVARKVARWGGLYALHVRKPGGGNGPHNRNLLRPQSERQLHLTFPAKALDGNPSAKLAALFAPLVPGARLAKAAAAGAGAELDEVSLGEFFDALADAGILETEEEQHHRAVFRLLPKERVGVRLLDGSKSASPLFRSLWLQGALHRVNAAEHTGLLDRDEREALEKKFKAKGTDAKAWYPNLVSATPTLEMGVDIGDLSTVLLCSVPPTQAKYLQRIGRSGRANGSALDVTVASTKPHDLYFFDEPVEMLRGEVASPGVFLDASEILRRQYLAFALGEWLLSPGAPALPGNVRKMLAGLPDSASAAAGSAGAAPAAFPENFFRWYADNASDLLDRFLARLPGIHRTTRRAMEDYALPELHAAGNLPDGIRTEIAAANTARKSYQNRKDALGERIRSVKRDESLTPETREKRVDELERERKAWDRLLRDLNDQQVLSWLCDTAGLLPNYAFPEPGIELQALLWRKDEAGGDTVFDKIEVARPASAGLTELVPGATFFTHGHRCDIDQVDLAATGIDDTHKGEPWRFCPECDYMEPAAGAATGPCPVCGADWSDGGQVRNLLKAKQFVTVKKAQDALIDDSSDDRKPLFHDCKRFFVRVSDDHLSFAGGDDDHPFGFEFIQHLVLTEVNFGRPSSNRREDEDGVEVNGRRIVGGSFRICPECGKAVDSEPGVRSRRFHTPTCSHSENPGGDDGDGEERQEEEGRILADFYRSFRTEALRIFAPFLGEEDDERIASFMAALQLGLQKKFGGQVDHLQMQLESMPAGQHGARRNFVILYDGIPGGTGYLRQFVEDNGARTDLIFDVMQLALDALRNCSCAADPSKDGCYHCLYRYRNQRDRKAISRRTAIRVLEELLPARGTLHKIDSKEFLGAGFRLAGLLESELERRFVGRLRSEAEKRGGRFEYACVRGFEEGVRLTFPGSDGGPDRVWEAVFQHDLGPADGVLVPSRPDAILYPAGEAAAKARPVAVFLDGWEYHRTRIADDIVKRTAIAKSGRFRVWSLAWQDVVPPPAEPAAPEWRAKLLDPALDENRKRIYGDAPEANSWRDRFIAPASEMDRLLCYLADADDARFAIHTRNEALALFTATYRRGDPPAAALDVPSGWDSLQRTPHLAELAVSGSKARIGLGAGSAPLLAVAFEDRIPENVAEADWRSFFSLGNFFQSLDDFLAFSTAGKGHSAWQAMSTAAAAPAAGAWTDALECAEGDDRLHGWLLALQAAGAPPPEVFSDLARADGEIVGTALMCWDGKKLAVVEEAVTLDGWTILRVPGDGDEGFIEKIVAALSAS